MLIFLVTKYGCHVVTKISAKGPKTAPNPSKKERRKEQEGRTEENRRQPKPWSEATRGRSGPPQSHSNARRTKEWTPPPIKQKAHGAASEPSGHSRRDGIGTSLFQAQALWRQETRKLPPDLFVKHRKNKNTGRTIKAFCCDAGQVAEF